MQTGPIQRMLDAILDRARTLRDGASGPSPAKLPCSVDALDQLCAALLSGRGEASGTALAREILDHYASLAKADRLAFFGRLASNFAPDPALLDKAWHGYAASRSPAALTALMEAVEPPRQELFRRLNRAPGGTHALVAMRADLLAAADPALAAVDADLVHLFHSWFNRGFLVMERISWSSPADVLERIIRYEAVHRIQGWDDLRRRVAPADRRCYAFFHPSLVDEPLIFVEVALTGEIPTSIQHVLAADRAALAPEQATTAVFYSISNCQPGLRSVSFGNFLIKQVVEELARELPHLRTFVTLSPVPGFAAWLASSAADAQKANLDSAERTGLALLDTPDWQRDDIKAATLRPILLRLAEAYFVEARRRDGHPVDPVARFHLGNGARLERIHWLGDTSSKGMREAAGLMVSYLYDLDTIERNHEAYANDRIVEIAPSIRREIAQLAPQPAKARSAPSRSALSPPAKSPDAAKENHV